MKIVIDLLKMIGVLLGFAGIWILCNHAGPGLIGEMRLAIWIVPVVAPVIAGAILWDYWKKKKSQD
jgi:hypothetical protein